MLKPSRTELLVKLADLKRKAARASTPGEAGCLFAQIDDVFHSLYGKRKLSATERRIAAGEDFTDDEGNYWGHTFNNDGKRVRVCIPGRDEDEVREIEGAAIRQRNARNLQR